MQILVLGVSGMLGNAVFRSLSRRDGLQVTGTLRAAGDRERFAPALRERILAGIDVLDQDSLVALLAQTRPDAVINCVGLIKQLSAAKDPLVALPINALFPHRLSRLCQLSGARLVHISTDCVFSGRQGDYRESDTPDAEDLYGRSKQLGEVVDQAHAITLRTSIIGHELRTRHALVDWFLSSQGQVRGFTRAVFSGLPTVELARVIAEHVLPDTSLHGLYQVSAEPIAKHDLLQLIAAVYGKRIELLPSEELVIDRSLNSDRFQAVTGYRPPAWPALIQAMHDDYLETKGQTDVR